MAELASELSAALAAQIVTKAREQPGVAPSLPDATLEGANPTNRRPTVPGLCQELYEAGLAGAIYMFDDRLEQQADITPRSTGWEGTGLGGRPSHNTEHRFYKNSATYKRQGEQVCALQS